MIDFGVRAVFVGIHPISISFLFSLSYLACCRELSYFVVPIEQSHTRCCTFRSSSASFRFRTVHFNNFPRRQFNNFPRRIYTSFYETIFFTKMGFGASAGLMQVEWCLVRNFLIIIFSVKHNFPREDGNNVPQKEFFFAKNNCGRIRTTYYPVMTAKGVRCGYVRFCSGMFCEKVLVQKLGDQDRI